MQVKTFYVSNGFIKNQCYLIYKGNNGLLIDPAWDYPAINGFINSRNINLKAILLTHGHTDHVDLAPRFSKEKNVPVFISTVELEHFGFEYFNTEKVHHFKEILIGSFKVIPIITPGHTPGSTCYLVNSHLFSGDTVFVEGVGICAEKDIHKLYDSVQLLKKCLPESTKFWPGHSFGESPGKSLKYLLDNNIYFQLPRKYFVNLRMRKNRSNLFSFS